MQYENEKKLTKRAIDQSKLAAEKKIKSYSKDETVDCWVNPQAPNIAILKHGTLAPLYTIWFPGLFVVAGLGIIFNGIKRFNFKGQVS